LEIVKEEMRRTGVEMLGVSEIWWTGKGYFESDDFTVYYSGHDNMKRNGVAIILKKNIAQTVLGYNPVNDRIISIRIQGRPLNITLMQVYAPTSDAEEVDIEEFYNKLQKAIDNTSKKDVLLVVGDLNAKVGNEEENEITGKFGLGRRNEAGERLIEFCKENSLCIMNTKFKQHKRRLYTWTSPNGLHRNQIDYILCQQRWKSSVQSTRTLPGADCGTDHELLVAGMRIKLKKVNRTSLPKRYDLENIPAKYAIEVRNRFSALDTVERNPEELWEEISEIVKEEAKRNIPTLTKKKKSKWLSEQAIKIADERRKMKARGDVQGMRRLNADFQRQARKDKETYLNKECMEIEENNKRGRTRDLFKKIRDITGKFTPRIGVMKNRDGKDLGEEFEIKKRWKEYTEELYMKDSNSSDIHQEIDYTVEPMILESEVRWAMNELADRKSPGDDGLPIELFKAAGEDSIQVLTALCQQVWKKIAWPKEWKRSVFIPIPKKGDSRECANNRTIALLPHASKVLLKVLQGRLEPYMEREMPAEQAGFRRGRGTRDQIANLRWIMEGTREYQKEIFMCFLDYSKAFDCVDHDKLWIGLRTMGVPEHLILLIKSVYKEQEATVRTAFGNTDWFKIGKGVRQGCILSPYLFNMYSEYIMRKAGLEEEEAGIKIGGIKINNLRYADDTTLMAEGEEDLRRLLRKIKEESLRFGLKLNMSKTKIMTTGRCDGFDIDGENVEVVKSFIFLGSRIEDDGGCEADVRRRLMLGRSAMIALNKIMKDKDVSRWTKIRIIKAMVFPVTMYGCESWTLRKRERKKIDAFELWIWRRLLRVPWTAKRTNQSILNEVRPEFSIEALMLKQRLSYFGHVMRAERSLEKKIMLGKIGGSRRRGRQRMRWVDGVKEATGMSLQQLRDATAKRSTWRGLVHGVTRSRRRLDGT
jgi:exonuclease III